MNRVDLALGEELGAEALRVVSNVVQHEYVKALWKKYNIAKASAQQYTVYTA